MASVHVIIVGIVLALLFVLLIRNEKKMSEGLYSVLIVFLCVISGIFFSLSIVYLYFFKTLPDLIDSFLDSIRSMG